MLKLYNSLTKKKETFTPINSNKVGVYVCGMTVYDYCHLGHARSMVCFDVVVRHLRFIGYDVHYVRNITDIDDKIINRANENKEHFEDLTQRFIKAMHEDERALHINAPDNEPKATQYIPHIIQLIERLKAKGYAYLGDNGDVYFDVSKYGDYGRLACKDLSGQEAGCRVEVVADKRSALDFVLWKKAKPNEPRWDSPWGQGRPGWHIECSAMSMDNLGDHFDIHGGGFDLQFPHHENEIAQSECASGQKFANYWMHVGFLNINKQKMSKSLGNFFTIRDVLREYNAETIRYFLISSHYRSQLNYSLDNLNQARQALERLYQSLERTKECDAIEPQREDEWIVRFIEFMNDDFNTPKALALLFELSHELNRAFESQLMSEAVRYRALLVKLANILGLLTQKPSDFLQAGKAQDEIKTIESLIKERDLARQQKQYQVADKIRQQLLDMGIEILDGEGGTTWRKA